MDKSKLVKLKEVYPKFIHQYETFISNPSQTEVEKINSIIQQLNRMGQVSNSVVKSWNDVMAWLLHDGIAEITQEEIDSRLVDITNAISNALTATTDAETATENAILATTEAVKQASYAKDKGDFIASKESDIVKFTDESKSVQKQLDDFIKTGGNSAVEVIQARGSFPLLKDRLDSVTAELAQKLTKGESGSITHAMLSQEVREEMTGGSVAVVGKDAVLTENIAKGAVTLPKIAGTVTGKNMFNPDARKLKSYIDQSTLKILLSDNYDTSDYIPVIVGESYTFTNCRSLINCDESKVSISGQYLNGAGKVTVVATQPFIAVDIAKTTINTAQVEKGTVATTYEPYKIIIPLSLIEKFETGAPYDQSLNTTDNVSFNTVTATTINVAEELTYSAISVGGSMPTGTLSNPPAGLQVSDMWADTTDSAQHPTLRVKLS